MVDWVSRVFLLFYGLVGCPSLESTVFANSGTVAGYLAEASSFA